MWLKFLGVTMVMFDILTIFYLWSFYKMYVEYIVNYKISDITKAPTPKKYVRYLGIEPSPAWCFLVPWQKSHISVQVYTKYLQMEKRYCIMNTYE